MSVSLGRRTPGLGAYTYLHFHRDGWDYRLCIGVWALTIQRRRDRSGRPIWQAALPFSEGRDPRFFHRFGPLSLRRRDADTRWAAEYPDFA